MSRRIIKVQYYINDEKRKPIQIESSATIGDFLHQVRTSEKNADICAVYIRGRQLDLDDLVMNHVKGKDDILIVSDDPTKTSADFVDANVPILPDDREQNITESLRNSLKQTDDVIRDVFKSENKFRIYTTVNAHSLLSGDKISIKDTDTFKTISNKIRNLILGFDEKDDLPEDFEIHIFLPGGIPFLSGKISSYFDSIDVAHNNLYVVVTKELGDLIDTEVKEPCNCKDSMANALSPLYDSSEAGLTQIASFLGYIYHHGINAEHILLVLAKVTRFVPLITNYFRLLENAPLTYLNIIAITGPLFTFFKSLVTEVSLDQVFEYTLKIISYIGLLNDVEYLHIHTIDVDNTENENEADIREYLQDTEQQNHVVIWEIDTAYPGFKGFNINETEFDKIDDIFNAVSTYKPVPPLSLHYIYYPTFIRGNDANHVMLYLREVPNKKKVVRYIDPQIGEIQKINLDELARKLHCEAEENAMDLIDSAHVDQINFICFDQSTSMKFKLEGGNCIHGEPSRADISSDFLRALIEQSYKFRVSSIYGLISFGSEVKTLQKLTPMSSDFVEKLSKIVPKGSTLLWDAIAEAQKQILELVAPDDEEEEPEAPYPNAHRRIIVITDGSDNKSKKNPVELANQLIQNNIIVDTVLISLDSFNNECCALSKMTGGLCFRPKSREDGLKIFEQEAFLNISSRHLSGPNYGEEIDDKLFKEKSKEFEEFDEFAENQEILNAKCDFSLSTPLYMCYQYKSKDPETIRKKRALVELNIIGHHPIDDCQVYSSHANPIEWRIFIKGPSDTPYEDKWLNIFMTLPNEYPLTPPKFRFLTIPFHPNVSSEGTVVFSLVSKKYKSTLGIGEIIEGIIKLLANPEEDSPVNLEAARLYQKDDKSQYVRKQNEGDTGVDDYEEYIKAKVYSDVPEDVEIEEEVRNNPLYMTNANSSLRGKILEFDIDDDKYDD